MPPRRRIPTPEIEESESVNTPQNAPPPSPPHPNRKIAELFLRQNPPIFTGTGNPSEAEDWVRAMERIFKFLECTSKECLLCISFQLKGPADYWWESRQKILTPAQLELFTWEQFKEELYAKYIPRSYRRKKEIEFANLRQGKESIAEYDREFCTLARYAPNKVETDEKMAELFRSGLRQEIRVVLAAQPPMSYAETLNRALDMEMELQPDKVVPEVNPTPFQTQAPSSLSPPNQGFSGKRKGENRNFPNKKPWQNSEQLFQKQLQLPYPNQAQMPPKQPRVPPCSRCNKMHLGQCRWGSNACYTCGQMGHYSNNCPTKLKPSGSGRKSNFPKPAQTLKAIAGYSQPFPPPPVPFQQHAPQQFAGYPAQSSQQSHHQKAFALNQKSTEKCEDA